MRFWPSISALLAASALAALLAGAAPGFVPQRAAQLQVIDEGSQESVEAMFSPRVAAPARLTFYVPQGYGLSLSAAPGKRIGSANAEVLTDRSYAYNFPDFAFGDLTVGNPALGLDATAQACSAGSHAAVWVATLELDEGPSFTIRIYVDPTSGDEVVRGAFRLVACFPSPYVPALQGGAPLGAQFASFELNLPVTKQPASGSYAWRLLVTPFLYGTATPDDASTFEVRTRVLVPHVLTLTASYQAKTKTLLVSGRLLGNGKPRQGVTFRLWVEADDPFWGFLFNGWTVKTRADGTYSLRKRLPQAQEAQTLTVSTFFSSPGSGRCGGPPIVPGGCVDESLSPPADPPDVTVKVPRLDR